MQRCRGAIFQQDNAQTHTTRVLQDCVALLLSFLDLPEPQTYLQSSISGIIWDGLEIRMGEDKESPMRWWHSLPASQLRLLGKQFYSQLK
ncbi:hypothetical protein TNCV_1048421 [Trichonephila clavipes]|nr:hypothetical protein TNCV_1048421 [Trichonephila clavipes]